MTCDHCDKPARALVNTGGNSWAFTCPDHVAEAIKANPGRRRDTWRIWAKEPNPFQCEPA